MTPQAEELAKIRRKIDKTQTKLGRLHRDYWALATRYQVDRVTAERDQIKRELLQKTTLASDASSLYATLVHRLKGLVLSGGEFVRTETLRAIYEEDSKANTPS